MDRFLLCENPMMDEFRPIYILQTIKHRMIIEVIPYDELSEVKYKLSDVFDLFEYKNSDGYTENYMLKVVTFFDLKTHDEIDENIEEIRLHLKKAFNWYRAYLEFSDSQIDEERFNGNARLN